ncbi:type III-B CRISPR module RAMP protein Cmr6 [Thermus scotoductus]|uniref:Type III-B CRISPR module RAMP protein Cmr6 n=1 Tax=Thermus scotoductus TaxID=37636 RepID=A0A430VAK3_THESC|nr:type III-B CRISPR module RAMP protein Cmr6 [Thermus scotoductus]RTI48159.1 type III-B CRISPR module RAMP protein Cmr6 [Thermus scotoductus]
MGRRLALDRVRFPGGNTHLGLWLDKFLKSSDKDDTESKQALIREVAGKREPEEYKAFFQRYREALEAVGAELRTAHTLGRLVVGLGGEGVLETSITLHRTYGVPYIPGSALKGLASRFAHLYLEGEAWRRNLREFKRGNAQEALFGTTEEQGMVVFFDALPEPGTWELRPDILNPHHQAYNAGGQAPPADWDSPIPVPFLSATGTFLLALAPAPGVDPGAARPWLDAAWQILSWALKEEGVGAKTSSGYGRMNLVGSSSKEGKNAPGAVAMSAELNNLLTEVRSLSYRVFTDFLRKRALVIVSLSPEETAVLRLALQEKKFLANPKDLKAEAKKDPALQKVLAKLEV